MGFLVGLFALDYRRAFRGKRMHYLFSIASWPVTCLKEKLASKNEVDSLRERTAALGNDERQKKFSDKRRKPPRLFSPLPRMRRRRAPAHNRREDKKNPFQEPRIKWGIRIESKAFNLHKDMRSGIVPLLAKNVDGRSTVLFKDIYSTMRCHE
eukprot:scaffold11660_cov113-Cylindrotheca_fusiformis.AAC.2